MIDTIHSINKNILIIIRPHPTSKIDDLKHILEKSKHKNIRISFTNSLFLIQYCNFMIRYGISLMDPKVKYYNKVCIRYHTKEILAVSGAQISDKEKLPGGIFDVKTKKDLREKVLNALNNKIKIRKNNLEEISEEKILKKFINYLN